MRSRKIRRRAAHSGPPTSAGFTLVELLVVITVIGILIALLVPAVQSARASGRRFTCANNLYHLGQAVAQHESKLRQFPTGGWGWHWVGDPDRGFDKRQTGGWVYNILPFIQQEALHQLPSDKKPLILTTEQKDSANLMTKTPLRIMNCPTRRRTALFAKVNKGTFVAYNASENSSSHNVSARGDYAANAGSQSKDEYFPGPESLEEGDSPGFKWHDTSLSSGISFERSEIRMAHVTDGKTYTIMLGEKYLNPDSYSTGEDLADNENLYTGYNNDNFRSTNANYRPMQDTKGYCSTYRFGSAHADGCHFVFCDGAVRLIAYRVNPTTYSYLGSRSDDEALDMAEF